MAQEVPFSLRPHAYQSNEIGICTYLPLVEYPGSWLQSHLGGNHEKEIGLDFYQIPHQLGNIDIAFRR